MPLHGDVSGREAMDSSLPLSGDVPRREPVDSPESCENENHCCSYAI